MQNLEEEKGNSPPTVTVLRIRSTVMVQDLRAKINHFQNHNDVAVNMDRVESTSVSSPPTMDATPAVCVPAAASADVPAVAKPSVMGVKRGSATNGRFRLGKTPSPFVVSAPSPVLVSAPVV